MTDHIKFTVNLTGAVEPQSSFGIQLFLNDDAQVPVDKRFILVTKEDYTELDASSVFYKYANVFFSQTRTADYLVLGRSLESDSLPYWYSGTDADFTVATWEAISTGSFNIDDGTSNEDITGLDFTGITAQDQIVDEINTALTAAVTVTGMVASFDLYNRLVITSAATGDTVTLDDAASGASLSTLLDYANDGTVATVAEETLQESTDEIAELGQPFWNINQRGSWTNAELVTYAQYIESSPYSLDLVYATADALTQGGQTDLGYLLTALNLDRTMCIYTDRGDYPDAACAGLILPGREGAISWSWNALANTLRGGVTKALTTTQRSTLGGKRYNWVETSRGITKLYPGITSGNKEKRIILGKDWYEYVNELGVFNLKVENDFNGIDNDFLGSVQDIIETNTTEAIDRKIILNTPGFPYTITLPDADDIPLEQRLAREIDVDDAFSGTINVVVNDSKFAGNWSS